MANRTPRDLRPSVAFDVLDDLAAQPGIKFVEPNYLAHAQVIPNDPDFVDQWHLKNDDDQDIDANGVCNV